MSTITKEQLIKRLEEQESGTRYALSVVQDSEILRDIEMDLHLIKITLASLKAELQRNPVLAYADSYRDMAKRGVASIPVWSVITDLERNIAPLFTAPPAPVVPETLPCPVLLEPGLKFGKGVRTQCMLDALNRRVEYHAELDAMTPDQRAEHDAGIAEFKAMLGNDSRAAMLQVADGNTGKPLTITLPDISSKAFWSGVGKNETFHPETYLCWVKEAIERSCTIARVDVEVK